MCTFDPDRQPFPEKKIKISITSKHTHTHREKRTHSSLGCCCCCWLPCRMSRNAFPCLPCCCGLIKNTRREISESNATSRQVPSNPFFKPVLRMKENYQRRSMTQCSRNEFVSRKKKGELARSEDVGNNYTGRRRSRSC
jgi:hypothetical protein